MPGWGTDPTYPYSGPGLSLKISPTLFHLIPMKSGFSPVYAKENKPREGRVTEPSCSVRIRTEAHLMQSSGPYLVHGPVAPQTGQRSSFSVSLPGVKTSWGLQGSKDNRPVALGDAWCWVLGAGCWAWGVSSPFCLRCSSAPCRMASSSQDWVGGKEELAFILVGGL